MTRAERDQNNVPTILGVSSTDNLTPIPVQINPVTGRMLVNVTGGTSPLTSKGDIYTNNGLIDVRLGVGTNGQVLTANSAQPEGLEWTGAGAGDVVGPASATDGVPALFDGITGKLLKNSTPTGTGNPVMQTSPTLTTPDVGVATATSINGATITSGTLNGSVTGTNTGDQTTITGNAGTATALETARTIGGTSFDGTANIAIGALNSTNVGATTSAQLLGVISDETGTGALVFATSPTLVTPALGTPASGVATNITGLPEGGLSLTDITTNDVSTSKHGFAPKGSGVATEFLNGNGAYSTPAGGGGGAAINTAIAEIRSFI